MRWLSSSVGARVAAYLARHETYAARMAEKLGISKQLAYYYCNQMRSMGILSVKGEVEVRGGRAKIYSLDAESLSVVLRPDAWRRSGPAMSPELERFLAPAIRDGLLDCLIVVGSPHPHGPLRSMATDGHYGFQLGLFLGRYASSVGEFRVRLDVDTKAERLLYQSMILIGGPGTNIITAMVNPNMPIRFNESNYWAGIISPRQVYSAESCGVVAKIPHPLSPGKSVHVLAGLRSVGTKAAIIALTERHAELLRGYKGEAEWAAVVQGLDLDGDGHVDSVEVLEKT